MINDNANRMIQQELSSMEKYYISFIKYKLKLYSIYGEWDNYFDRLKFEYPKYNFPYLIHCMKQGYNINAKIKYLRPFCDEVRKYLDMQLNKFIKDFNTESESLFRDYTRTLTNMLDWYFPINPDKSVFESLLLNELHVESNIVDNAIKIICGNNTSIGKAIIYICTLQHLYESSLLVSNYEDTIDSLLSKSITFMVSNKVSKTMNCLTDDLEEQLSLNSYFNNFVYTKYSSYRGFKDMEGFASAVYYYSKGLIFRTENMERLQNGCVEYLQDNFNGLKRKVNDTIVCLKKAFPTTH